MSDLEAKLARLSPAQRALFLKRLAARSAQQAPPTEVVDADRFQDARRRGRTVPLAEGQKPMWYLQRLQPQSCGYNVSLALAIEGRLDLGWLHASLADLVDRHESLRTTFALREGEPVQVVAPGVFLPLPTVDLVSLPTNARDALIERLATRDAAVPFDLGTGPLVRTMILRRAADAHVLLFEMHHIICDAWSLGVLIEELAAAYGARADGGRLALPPLPMQLGDFVRVEQRAASAGAYDVSLAYWRRQLRGLDTPELRTDRPRPAVETFRGAKQNRVLSQAVTAGLRAMARAGDRTLFMVVQAGFAVLLRHWTHATDVVIGTNISGRTADHAEGLIGLLLNTLVLRTDLMDAATFAEVLDRVRRTTLDAFAHADLPFSRLVGALETRRRPGHNPFFRVKLDFQMLMPTLPTLPGLRMHPLDFDYGRVHSDLTLYAAEAPDALHLVLEYSTDLFDADTIARLEDGLVAIFEAVTTDADVRIETLLSRLDTIEDDHRRARQRAQKAIQRSQLRISKRRAVSI